MKKLFLVLVAALFVLAAGQAMAGNTAQQTVGFQITGINEIAVSGNPDTLIISTSGAGSDPDPATNTATSYSVTTNATGKKIAGKIDSAMPTDTELNVTLAAPTGGTSAGKKPLTASDVDLVTGITKLSEGSLQISYEFTAKAEAGTLSSSRTVTFTLADAS